MKPVSGASHSSGLVGAVIVVVIAWVVIVWVTRRMKRGMSKGDQ